MKTNYSALKKTVAFGGIFLTLITASVQAQIDTTYSNSAITGGGIYWNSSATWTKTGADSETVPHLQNHRVDIINESNNRALYINRDGIHIGEFIYNTASSVQTFMTVDAGSRLLTIDKLIKNGSGSLLIYDRNASHIFSIDVGDLEVNNTILELGSSDQVLESFKVSATTTIVSGAQIRNSSGKTIELGHLNLTADNAAVRTSTRSRNGAIEVLSLTGNGIVEVSNSDSAVRGDFILNNTNVSPSTFSGVLRNGTTGTLHVTKRGTGTQQLSGVSTYTGQTTIEEGTLAFTGSGAINSSSEIVINGGTLAQNSSTALTAPITFTSGTISGSGQINQALSIGANQTLSPGNGIGSQTYGATQSWLADGNLNLQILDADGDPGVGFDTLHLSENLDLNGLSVSNRFNINLWSLSAPDTSGNALNFDNTQNYQFAILTATEIIIDDVANVNNYFNISTSAVNGTDGFTNALDGGNFSMSITGNTLFLNYNPIPEPTATLLMGISVLLFIRQRRRVFCHIMGK